MRTIFFAMLGAGRGVLAATMFASYLLGLFRDRIFAQTFGAGTELDAYQAAFLLPDFMLNFLVAGGLASVFVPIFLETRTKDPARAEKFARTVPTLFTLLMLAVGVVLFFLAPYLSALVAPGFDDGGRLILIRLMRVLSFSPVIFALSNALGGLLIAEKRFVAYGLSPVFYNLGIILATVLFVERFGIMAVAFGTIAGAFLHLAVRIIDIKKQRLPLRPALHVRLPELRQFVRLMIPKMFGHPVELATFWGFTAIASTMAAGSIAVLNFARNFQSVPISLIGISFATAAFPVLADSAAARNRADFMGEFMRTAKHIAALSCVAAIGIFVLREFIISLFLGGGEFGKDAIAKTALLLGIFAFSIPLESVSHLLARAFYATKNTVLPVLISIAALAVSVGGAWIFVDDIGLAALPLWYAFGSLVKIATLAILFPRQARQIQESSRS